MSLNKAFLNVIYFLYMSIKVKECEFEAGPKCKKEEETLKRHKGKI